MLRCVVVGCLLSVALAAAGTYPPEQIHIAFAGRTAAGVSDGVAFSWATANATATSTVLLGLTPDNLTVSVNGYALSYFPPEVHHHAVATGLLPSTVYYYQVGDASAGFSSVLSFKTAADPSSPSFSVAIYGDLGYGVEGNAVETRAQLDRVAAEYDWVLHVGDIGYADDYYLHDPLTFGYEKVYDGYMNWIQNVSATKAYMVLPGNHEGECHSPICLVDSSIGDKLRNFTAYNSRFRMPAQESLASGANMWFSFNYGSVHFIAVDTETDYPNAPMATSCPILPCGGFGVQGAQLDWLEKDLIQATADRKLRPWVIVSGHRPMYTPQHVNPDGSPSGECANLQAAFEGLFHKYGVDLYIAGHKHAYQRTYPVLNNTIANSYTNPPYPVHLIVGGAGCDEMTNVTATAPLADPAWIADADLTHYGMGILDVNSTALHWRWFESLNGAVLDQVTITKKA